MTALVGRRLLRSFVQRAHILVTHSSRTAARPAPAQHESRQWLARISLAACLLLSAFLARAMHAQSASLSGTVFLDASEKTLANAEVMLTDLNVSTRSDNKGNFTLNGLPAGKHALVVRLVGYESIKADITFSATQKVETDFLMRQISTKLSKVEVMASLPPAYRIKLAEFEDRRLFGMGHFMTHDEFEKADGRQLSDVLTAKLPGVHAVRGPGRGSTFTQVLASSRDGKGNCYLQVWVNGMIAKNNEGGPFDVNSLSSGDVIGLEFYSLGTTPLQFSGTGANCGTAVIWTK